MICCVVFAKKIYILTKTHNWVVLTVVNVRAVNNTLQLHENVVQNYIAIGISRSAGTLKVVMEGLKTNRRCDI